MANEVINIMSEELSTAIQEFHSICDESKSGSQVYDWGSLQYKDCIRHFLESSSEVAQIAVVPGSAEDLAKMMLVLQRCKVSFAVKGGGHGMAPGYSSTTGIHISMSRFSKVLFDPQTHLVEIGAGCLWDQVYSKLAPFKRNVVGGASADGVGVGGWLLGGGYSLKSNKYGLGIDNVVAFEIVTPDGCIRHVTAKRHPQLFQALRGGGNNFGIVTKFTLKTYSQDMTYGGYISVSGERSEELKTAILKFTEEERRPEAVAIPAFRHILQRDGTVESTISVFCVFDAEKPKRTDEVPFKQFNFDGEVWKSDPANWHLGKIGLSLNDSSTKRVHTAASKAKWSYKASNGNGNGVSNAVSWSNTSNANGESNPASLPGFKSMSFGTLYGVPPSSLPAKIGSIKIDASDDSGDEEVSNGQSNLLSLSASMSANADEVDEDSEDDADEEQHAAFDSLTVQQISLPTNGDDQDARLYDSDSDVEVEQGDLVAQRPLMVTQKADKMGELNERGRFGSLMVSKYSKTLLDAIAHEAQDAAKYLKSNGGLSVIIDMWPVHPAVFNNSSPGAAWPHRAHKPYGPILAYFRWKEEKDDAFWITKMKATLKRLQKVAIEQEDTERGAALYSNLSLETVPPRRIYRGNLEWLKQVKAMYDPTDVMGRTGGHKIPLP